MKREVFVPVVLLLCAVLLRGSLLEYTDLIDPTETRYASVAQEMVLLKDWLTPRLPMPEGIVPYMGKPPLHFWLTAGSYKLFGVDEWTTRLPSWLSTIAILLVVWSFGRRFFGKQTGIAAALITFSSGMLFFLAGASVTDVSLTALISGSSYLLYTFAQSGAARKRTALFASALMALAFLTKGPIAIVLVWLPLLLWSSIRRDFQWFKTIPWLSAAVVFFIITTPWFAINELSSPGSLKYFFWNENIARYLFKEYGDKYGSGHVHSFGASWLMLFAAFAPWSFILSWQTYRLGWRKVKDQLQSDPHLLFVLIWGISAAIFFTFVRQLHAMYLLPCIPGIALFTAALLEKDSEQTSSIFQLIKSKGYTALTACTLCGIIVAGVFLEFSQIALILGILLGIAGIFTLRKINQSDTRFAAVHSLSLSSFLVYLLVIVCLTPYIDERRSAAELLDNLADSTINQIKVPRVGIMAKNNYSLYWTAKAWQNELSRELHVEYVEPTNIPKGIKHLLISSEDAQRLPNRLRSLFTLANQSGKWQLLNRVRKVL